MTISGFTFVKNGIILDYPFLEAIQSILPLCDEVIVVVGDGEDDTKAKIEALQEPKIRIIDSVWDKSLRTGGQVLAQQTDLAMDAITGDWGFYIQADEVLHEKYIEIVRQAAQTYLTHKEIDGFLFSYKHFYGSYEYIGISRDWYRHEIRMVRNDKKIRSWKDAQGFRKNGKKLKVKSIPAEIYHYGWVRAPQAQQKKNELVNPLWHDDKWMKENVLADAIFEYDHTKLLQQFDGTHPACMLPRLQRKNWPFKYDPGKVSLSLKEKLSNLVERATGIRVGEYKNYIRIN